MERAAFSIVSISHRFLAGRGRHEAVRQRSNSRADLLLQRRDQRATVDG
jgi:hypothetical protein